MHTDQTIQADEAEKADDAHTQEKNLMDLPDDVLQVVASKLSVADLAAFSCVNTKCNQLADNSVWKNKFMETERQDAGKLYIAKNSVHRADISEHQCWYRWKYVHNFWPNELTYADWEVLGKPCLDKNHFCQETLAMKEEKRDRRNYKCYKRRVAMKMRRKIKNVPRHLNDEAMRDACWNINRMQKHMLYMYQKLTRMLKERRQQRERIASLEHFISNKK